MDLVDPKIGKNEPKNIYEDYAFDSMIYSTIGSVVLLAPILIGLFFVKK